MDTPIIGTGVANSTFGNGYFSSLHRFVFNSSEANVQNIMPCAGSISKLSIKVGGSPGVGKAFIFTLFVNGSSTSLSVTISGGNTSGSDLVNSVTVAAGDLVSIKLTYTGTPTAPITGNLVTCLFSGASSTSLILGGKVSGNLATSGTNYWNLGSSDGNYSSAAFNYMVIPTDGTLSNLYFRSAAAPGAGTSWTATVYRNGAAEAITCTIADAATSASDTTHSVSVSAGDLVCLRIVVSGSPTGSRGSHSIQFSPNVNGESIFGGGASNGLVNSAARYNSLHVDDSWSATEGPEQSIIQACTIKKLYVDLSASPGAGTSYTFTIRNGGASQSLTCSVADAATTANDTANSFTTSINDLVNLLVTPTNTPTSRTLRMGLVAYIAPPSVGTPRTLLGIGV